MVLTRGRRLCYWGKGKKKGTHRPRRLGPESRKKTGSLRRLLGKGRGGRELLMVLKRRREGTRG